MSPQVRLFCYPDDDGQFTSTSGMSLDVHVPDPGVLIHAVLERLRSAYPLVAIRVEHDDGAEAATWHVYRDGLPD
jgi:hypothetical protein